MATAVNEITGKIIKTGCDNQDAYNRNFDLIGKIEVKEQETMYPVTIKVPKQVFKAFAEIAKEQDSTVEALIQEVVLENYK